MSLPILYTSNPLQYVCTHHPHPYPTPLLQRMLTPIYPTTLALDSQPRPQSLQSSVRASLFSSIALAFEPCPKCLTLIFTYWPKPSSSQAFSSCYTTSAKPLAAELPGKINNKRKHQLVSTYCLYVHASSSLFFII